MHKLRQPTLLEEDDEDMSGFGNSSNRFLKTNRQESKPKDNFQKELEITVEKRNSLKKRSTSPEEELKSSNRFIKRENDSSNRVPSARTPTPRSIATDSDIAENSDNESMGFSGRGTTSMGESGWQPGLKKSPRSSFVDSRNQTGPTNRQNYERGGANLDTIPMKSPRDSQKGDNSADLSTKWNKPSSNMEDKRKPNKYNDDEDSSFGKSNVSFMKTGKFQDSKQQSFDTENSSTTTRPKPRISKFALAEEEEEDENSFIGQSSSKFLKTTKPSGLHDSEKRDVLIQPKPRSSKLNFDLNENDEDSFHEKPSSSRFLSNSTAPESKWKEPADQKAKPKLKDSKLNFNVDDDDHDVVRDKSSSSRFLKTTNIPDQKWKENEQQRTKPKSWETKLNLNPDEDEEDSFHDRLTSLGSTKTSNASDSKWKEKEGFSMKPKPRSHKANFNSDEMEIDNEKSRFPKGGRMSDDKTMKSDDFSSFSKSSIDKDEDFYPNPRQTKLRSGPLSFEKDDEDNSFPKPQKRGLKTGVDATDGSQHFQTSQFPRENADYWMKSDSIMKPRTMKENQFSVNPIRGKEHEMDLDFKRRSIRFEDEDKTRSVNSSPEKSPRKTNHGKSEIREARTPSPVTSVCEEFERDPVKQKLDEIKQRRQERKRQEERDHMTTEHRIAVDAIDAIESGQSQVDHPPTTKRKVIIPLNKKYQNIQPKISTKPNLRSVSMDNLNTILTKIDQPNTDRNYSASQAIRDATYLEWYKAKLKEDKGKNKEPVTEEKDTKEKRNEDDVKATYDAWLAKKKEYFAELKRKKEEEQKKQTDNKENKDSKDNTFELWKKLKDESKKKEIEKQKSEMKKTEKQKLKEIEDKKEELRKKNIEWEERQKLKLKMKKDKEDEEKRKQEEKKNKAEEKQMLAEVSYRNWEEKMEEDQRVRTIHSKRKEELVQSRRAWRPSSNTVAYGK